VSINLLDTSSQYLHDTSHVIAGTSFTVAAWVNTTRVYDSDAQAVFYCGKAGTATSFYMLWVGSNAAGTPLRWGSITDLGAYNIAGTANSMSANTWHHCCGIERGTDRTVVLDGDWANKGIHGVTSIPTGKTATEIGRRDIATPDLYMDGMIGELAVWTAAFADSGWEVSALAAGASPLAVRPAELQLYMRLQDVSMLKPILQTEGHIFTASGSPTTGASHPAISVPGGLGYVQYTPAAVGGSAVPAIMRYYRNRRAG